MYELFIRLVNNSLWAGICVLAIILLRLCLKKVPRKYICILWVLVALRLVMPFSISSMFSVYNALPANTNASGQMEYFHYSQTPEKPRMVYTYPITGGSEQTVQNREEKEVDVYLPTMMEIWLFGAMVMVACAGCSYASLRKEVAASLPKGDGVYMSDTIQTPFILGIVRPRIYVPSGIEEGVLANVIAHERAHLGRKDHWWKPLGFLLLCIHWFNPLIWAAYVLLCRDIEAACDERVVQGMSKEEKASYAEALLACAVHKKMITACPVAFGETDVKGRVKHVLVYKKPAFWVAVVASLICIVAAICFLTNATTKEDEPLPPETMEQQEENQNHFLGEITEVNEEDFFLDFTGSFFSSDTYVEPLHGEGAPKAWLALGGKGSHAYVGDGRREVFVNGELANYNYHDNHMSSDLVEIFHVDKYSCCLYRYAVDLFTAPEAEGLPEDVPTMQDFWVVFYTEGEGEPIQMQYFNCNYYLKDSAINSIAPGAEIIPNPVVMPNENCLVPYQYNPDTGDYVVEQDMVFMYKKVLSGIDPGSGVEITYVVLTNIEDVTWERIHGREPGHIIIGVQVTNPMSEAGKPTGRDLEHISNYLSRMANESLPAQLQEGILFREYIINWGGGTTDNWYKTRDKIQFGEPFSFVYGQITDEGDYTYIYVDYDGTDYYIVSDSRQDRFGEQAIKEYSAKYLVWDTSETYGGEGILASNLEGLTIDYFMKMVLSSSTVYKEELEQVVFYISPQ